MECFGSVMEWGDPAIEDCGRYIVESVVQPKLISDWSRIHAPSGAAIHRHLDSVDGGVDVIRVVIKDGGADTGTWVAVTVLMVGEGF